MSIRAEHAAVKADQQPGEPQRPGKKWKLAVLGIIAVFVGLACYDLASMAGTNQLSGAPTASSPAAAAARQPKSPAASRAPTARTSATPSAGRSASATAHVLDVTSVAAFGPDGTPDGDNPAIASRVLDVSTDQPWYSQWYATPDFGNLQSGTGLVLDMGTTVTINDVRLALGAEPGADVQLRVGDAPSLADLPPVATAFGVDGTVQLTATSPVRGRYVLIWFTQLPAVGQGHYQVSVYSAYVDGGAGS